MGDKYLDVLTEFISQTPIKYDREAGSAGGLACLLPPNYLLDRKFFHR